MQIFVCQMRMKKNEIPSQIYLTEEERPRAWYNIRADLPNLAPYLTEDNKVVTVEDLSCIFSKTLAQHELSDERFIEIPEAVDEIYKTFRPTPLHRAYRLEKMLGTPARLYYKYEGVNPSGSHKLNSAIPQVYYNKIEGIKKLTTETGAGQWGTALSVACNIFDVEAEVYMVKISAQQKKERKHLMESFGASVYESPTNLTESGKKVLLADSDSKGSLGIAISEAIEVAMKDPNAKYALGSVLNHVVMHQTIIGLEAQKQLAKVGEYPDSVIACCGGGSNFGGIAFPFVYDKIKNNSKVDIVGVEPAACPTITKGKYAYDFGDISHFTPKSLQYTLGNEFRPSAIHAGGLRYHGMGALVSRVMHDGYARAVSKSQKEIFDAAIKFTKAEAILPAPESAHAICEAIDQALACKISGEEKVILFNVSGHGQFDSKAYDTYFSGEMNDAVYTDAQLEEGFKSIPKTDFRY